VFYLFFDSAKVVFLNCYLNALYTCQDYRTHNPLIFDEVSIRTILLGCCDNRDGMSYLCNTIYMCTVTHQIVFTCVLLHIKLYLHVYCYTSNCIYMCTATHQIVPIDIIVLLAVVVGRDCMVFGFINAYHH
jgi:hypothetical protein